MYWGKYFLGIVGDAIKGVWFTPPKLKSLLVSKIPNKVAKIGLSNKIFRDKSLVTKVIPSPCISPFRALSHEQFLGKDEDCPK
jgi:hypothetical protein